MRLLVTQLLAVQKYSKPDVLGTCRSYIPNGGGFSFHLIGLRLFPYCSYSILSTADLCVLVKMSYRIYIGSCVTNASRKCSNAL